MSVESIPACPLALTPADLSAWRDGVLDRGEAQRIEAHLVGCAGCRERLEEYEAIAAGLRAIRVLDPIEGYGRNPRLQPQRTQRIRLGLPCRRLLGGIGALAAALLVALAFAQVFSSFGRHVTALRTPVPSVTPSSTPTALPTLTLPWKPATFPPGFTYSAAYPNLSIVPTDGLVAYACVLSPRGQGLIPHLWQTRDRGLGWTQVFSGQVVRVETNTCTMYADAFNPQVAVVSAAWAFHTAPPSPNGSTSYTTFDGGSTWHQLAGNELVTQPATVGSATYAILRVPTGDAAGPLVQTDLAVSRDNMKTWTPIDQAITAAKYAIKSFWLNRATGELLVEASDPDQGNLHLWSSMDSGQYWRELAPVSSTGFVVQVGDRGPSWDVCTLRTDAAINGQTSALACSTDGSQRWGERPLLVLPFDNQGGKNPGLTTYPAFPVAIAADGAILAIGVRALLPAGCFQGYTLYRLVPGATQWQSLGPLPWHELISASAPDNGLL
jgi:Putative zinc-finger